MAGEIIEDLELSSDDSTSRRIPKKEKKERKDKEKKEKKERKEKKKDEKDAKPANGDAAPDTNGSLAEAEQPKEEKREKRQRKEKAEAKEQPETADSSSPERKKKKRKSSEDDDEDASAKKLKATASSSPSSSSPSSSTSASLGSPLDSPDALGHPPLSSYPISASTLSVLQKKGITHAFPIQSSTFHPILECHDLVGRARTGTGKTLAFALPVCERLQAADAAAGGRLKVGRAPRVIVLTPTRELAKQVSETFTLVGPRLSTTTVYGGSAYPPMEAALRRGVDVVVGTCGRVQDLLERGALRLNDVGVIILDEADEMLNMGFADDVEKILQSVDRSLTHPIQTLLFSATIPSWVQNVAKKYLKPDHKRVDLVGEVAQKASATVSHYAIACHWSERNALLKEVIAAYGSGEKTRTIVFTETKKVSPSAARPPHSSTRWLYPLLIDTDSLMTSSLCFAYRWSVGSE